MVLLEILFYFEEKQLQEQAKHINNPAVKTPTYLSQ